MSSVLQSHARAVPRGASILVLLAVLSAYALAVPPAHTFGSEQIEHLKDLVAVSLAILGLTYRCFAQVAHGDARTFARMDCAANVLVLSGIFLMHGNLYVVLFGVPASAAICALVRPAGGAAAALAAALALEGSTLGARVRSAAAREWLIVSLTLALLVFTEVYEDMHAATADSLQVVLLVVIVLLMVTSGAGLALRPSRTAPQTGKPATALATGPATRGIRVDGRVDLVDSLENWLSLGRLKRILDATLDAAQLSHGDRLVDVGCGSGALAIKAASILKAPLGIEATGIDATPGMIELARANARAAGSAARFELGVGEALPLEDGSVDAVTSSYFFHHLPPTVKRQALREMWRVLAPGGRLVITDYGKPTRLAGQLAAFPMRFNFHEYVRGQLGGELDALLIDEGLPFERLHSFLGYINVVRVRKAI